MSKNEKNNISEDIFYLFHLPQWRSFAYIVEQMIEASKKDIVRINADDTIEKIAISKIKYSSRLSAIYDLLKNITVEVEKFKESLKKEDEIVDINPYRSKE